MREQSFRWVGHVVDGMELVFALTGPGMGLGLISFVWGMAADGNRHVCRKSAGQGNTFTGRMWKRFASSFLICT